MTKYTFNPIRFKKFVLSCLGYITFMSTMFVVSLFVFTHLDLFTTIPAYQEIGQNLKDFWLF